jgi:hypothetical protein
MQQQIEWRRAKVVELLSKGESNQSEISRVLQVYRSIICRDSLLKTAGQAKHQEIQ